MGGMCVCGVYVCMCAWCVWRVRTYLCMYECVHVFVHVCTVLLMSTTISKILNGCILPLYMVTIPTVSVAMISTTPSSPMAPRDMNC